MPYRRFRSMRRRRRGRWQWVRQFELLVPNENGNMTTTDLLRSFRTVSGWSIQFPEITIWRVHLKITVRLDVVSGAESEAAALVAMYMESTAQALASPLFDQYNEKFMAWEVLPVGSIFQNGVITPPVTNNVFIVYKDFDVKARRRLQNVDDTLILQVESTTGASLVGGNFSSSVLMKLP